MNKNCPIIITAVGFFTLIFGITCSWYLFPAIVEHQINQNIALKEGTQAYTEWKKQSFPLKFKVHFFNVTNPSEVQQGARPILTEMGPYIYDEYREKINININDEEDTIEYTLKKTYFFNQKESGCRTEDDVVVMLNAGLVGIALQVEAILPTAMSMVEEAIPYLFPNTKDIFLRTKVRDILFDGLVIHCSAPEVDFICSAMRGALPPTISVHPNGHDFLFSMFGHLNGTDDGPYVMGRGLKNTTRGDILKWKDSAELTQWNGKYCNTINGSDSTVFYRMDKPAPRIYSFAQDFCRSMFASYDGDMTYKGMHVYKYVSKEESINNNADNECFCPKTEDENGNEVSNCPTSGLVNMMPCVEAPILISYPHFYLADKSLLEYPIGVKPIPEIHGSYAYFEPKTATPLSGMKRIQMNLKIKQLENFELLTNVTGGVFPLFWVEEGVDLPDDLVKFLQKSFMQIKMLSVVKWIITAIGMGLIIVSFVMVLHKERLMCFSKVGVMELNDPKRQNVNISTISNMQNPSLYPQADNKNIHDNFRRNNNNNNSINRNNNSNGNNNEMLQFKM